MIRDDRAGVKSEQDYLVDSRWREYADIRMNLIKKWRAYFYNTILENKKWRWVESADVISDVRCGILSSVIQ